MSKPAATSYTQILRSSSLIGAAQGINLLLGMVRVKFAAMLIGPIGVGMLGNYVALQGLVTAIAGLGIQTSGVRDVAEAVGKGDPQTIGRTILTLRRICWLTGLAGALAMVALSPVLSQWAFGSGEHTFEIALLGLIILLGNVSAGQIALIQGLRRIGDLARLNVIGSVAGTVITIGCYTALGLAGIVPALLLMGMLQLAASWYFARKVPVPEVVMSWRESFHLAGGMVRLGLIFMWAGLAASLVAFITRALVTQQLGLPAVGIFGAAFALSGIFVTFILGAMGADYYPRLTAVASDHEAVKRLVNEQTEIGLLLAVPGLLATLSLAPWIIRIFYTEAFLPAADLLQWFILGCMGQVISWPLGFVMLAQGKGKWFFATETLANTLHLGLIWWGLVTFGIEGVAIGFFILHLVYIVGVYGVARHLTNFHWSSACSRLMLWIVPTVAATFLVGRMLPIWPATIAGLVATMLASVVCLRSLVKRTGAAHRIARIACQIPGLRWACGL